MATMLDRVKTKLINTMRQDSRIIGKSFKQEEEGMLIRSVDDLFENENMDAELISNLEFIKSLIKLDNGTSTCIIDYQNLEELARDRNLEAYNYNPNLRHLPRSNIKSQINRIKFRIPIVLIIKWAIENNIINIIIILKRNRWIYDDIAKIINGDPFENDLNGIGRQGKYPRRSSKYIYSTTNLSEAIRGLNIITMDVHGIRWIGREKFFNTHIFHDMKGSDDAIILMLTKLIYDNLKGSKDKDRIKVLSSDQKMLQEKYLYIPPFKIDITQYISGIKQKTKTVLMDTLTSDFFNQNFEDYTQFLNENYNNFIYEKITPALLDYFYFQPTKGLNWVSKPVEGENPTPQLKNVIAVLNTHDREHANTLLNATGKKLENTEITEYYKKYLKYKKKYLELKNINSTI